MSAQSATRRMTHVDLLKKKAAGEKSAEKKDGAKDVLTAPAGWFDAWGVWQNPRSARAPGPEPGTTEFVTAQLNSQLLGGLVPWGVYDEEIEQRRVLLQWPDGDHGEPALFTMRHQPWRHPQWATPLTTASDTAPAYRVGAPPLLDPFLIPTVPAPQVRSLVYVPPGRVVPNFGFTPRTCVSPARLREFLQSTDTSIVAMPALAGVRLLRLYYHSAAVGWAVASNACARETPEPGGPHAEVVALAAAGDAASTTGADVRATGGGFFNRPGMGMLGGLAAGFLGAGLLGMLFGGADVAGEFDAVAVRVEEVDRLEDAMMGRPENLDTFGFDYEFASATDYYTSGRFDAALLTVLVAMMLMSLMLFEFQYQAMVETAAGLVTSWIRCRSM